MLLFLDLHGLSKEIVWAKLVLNRAALASGAHLILPLEVQLEESPRAIEAHIGSELLSILVRGHSCSMHSDDISDFLADGQIIELISEEDD